MIRLPGFLRAVDSSLGETMKEENKRVDIARERRGTLRRNMEPGKSIEIEGSCRELSYVTRFTCLAGYLARVAQPRDVACPMWRRECQNIRYKDIKCV